MIEKITLLNSLKSKMKHSLSYSFGEENLLCQFSLHLTPEQLFFKKSFTHKEFSKIERALHRRLKGEPLNKIFKHQSFFGLNFFINKNVLAPRPETEILCQKVLEFAHENFTKADKKSLDILDLCCGSGCIGLSLAKHLSAANLTLSDVSPQALFVARRNRKLLNIKNAKVVKSDLFSQLKKSQKFDIIACNPPYIETNLIPNLSPTVKEYDPIIALDGGADGLDFYRKIAQNADKFLTKDGKIFLEIGFSQKHATREIFKQNSFETTFHQDFSGNDRVLEAKRGINDKQTKRHSKKV